MSDEKVIRIIARAHSTPQEREEIVSLCTAAYGIDFEPIIDSYGNDITHVCLRRDDNLISHALWITRWVQIGDGPLLRTAYIEAVATHPDFRLRGYASEVMRAVAREIQNYDIAALSPSDHHYYVSLGWELWQGPLLIRQKDDTIPAPAEDQAMILRLPGTPVINKRDSISIEWRETEPW